MNVIYELSKDVKPEEVIQLRAACGHKEPADMWRKAIDLSLCVAAARDADAQNKLIGVGFVVGNNRHAQLVDLVVHPDYRQQGIGGKLFDMRVKFCRAEKILYVGNTFDPANPWLKEFYAKHGFKQIDFAMWLSDSIDNLNKTEPDENRGEL